MQRIPNYIDGTLVEPTSGAYLDNIDPAVGAAYSVVPDSNSADLESAVDAAVRAQPAWAATAATERSRVMLRMAELIDENFERLALAECIDTGKPLDLARRVDIPRAAANLRFFATAILHTSSESHMTDSAAGGSAAGRALNYTLRQPRGVAACISPWNLPLYLFTWKIAPALATGNTVVGKPSEVTPMTASLLGELCIEAGLPPGVLNIVHGAGPTVGAALVTHPLVRAVSFTGGTATGRTIAHAAADSFKRVSLELGGKNPNLIFADADLDRAIEVSVASSFANQGQVCLCGSRILIERAAADRFVTGFIARVRELKVGDPLDSGTDQGAVVSRAHLDKINACLDLARSEGGTVLCGGRRPDGLPARCANGFFLEPTVIVDLPPDCRTNREEIFGPVVSVTPFDNEAEAIAAANDTPYGLSASIWTSDLDRAHRVAERVDCGTIWINTWLLRDLRVPFGGMKESGVGREGGIEALRFFTEAKNVCVRLG